MGQHNGTNQGVFMSVKVIVGTQWGDEGKGKITDMLAEKGFSCSLSRWK